MSFRTTENIRGGRAGKGPRTVDLGSGVVRFRDFGVSGLPVRTLVGSLGTDGNLPRRDGGPSKDTAQGQRRLSRRVVHMVHSSSGDALLVNRGSQNAVA